MSLIEKLSNETNPSSWMWERIRESPQYKDAVLLVYIYIYGFPSRGIRGPHDHLIFKAHLHYIRDLGPSNLVRASESELVRNQNKWNDVLCLRSPCPRFSLHIAIFSDADVPSSSKVVQWACPKPPVHVVATAGYQNVHGLGWPWIWASDVV